MRSLSVSHKMRRPSRVMAVAFGLSVLMVAVSLCVGRYPLSLSQIWGVVAKGGNGETLGADRVFLHVRLPRVILVFFSGGSLALAGATLQGMMRNPLVSPDIIGVSAGASLGAAVAIVLVGARSGALQAWAFGGGLLAVLAAYSLSRATGGSVISLVLSGIIINALAQAGVSLLKYVADPFSQLPALEFWLLGGFYNGDWKKLLSVVPGLSLGCLAILLLRWQVNVLSQGEEEAQALGVRLYATRLSLICACALLVACVVSVAGTVGWVGLVAPHMARLLGGNDHKIVLPLSFACGGNLLLLADTLARTWTMAEIPVSVITAVVGAPFLAYLLWKVGAQSWDK